MSLSTPTLNLRQDIGPGKHTLMLKTIGRVPNDAAGGMTRFFCGNMAKQAKNYLWRNLAVNRTFLQ